MNNDERSGDDAHIPMPIEQAVRRFFPYGGATRATLLSACRTGKLGYAKIGNRYLVTGSEIEDWLKNSRIERSPSAVPKAIQLSPSPTSIDFASRSLVAEKAAYRKIRILLGNWPPRKPYKNDSQDDQTLPEAERTHKLRNRIDQWLEDVKDSDLNMKEREVLLQLTRRGVGDEAKPSAIRGWARLY